MTKTQITKMLKLHKLWLDNDPAGARANLRDADLSGANLHGADLRDAILRYADLSNAILRNANLHGADLRDAILRYADLSNANLSDADLSDANLYGAILRGAYLCDADLYGADLYGAILSDADLCGANLRYANLRYANLRGANLGAPSMILLAHWGSCSDEVTIQLMRLDASAHPNPEKFDIWAAGGACPYSGEHVTRIVNFVEDKVLWSSGPPPTIWEAVNMLLKEHTKDWEG